MIDIEIVGMIVVSVFILAAICSDIKSYCIPNGLNFTFIIGGMLYSINEFGITGMMYGLTGVFIPIVFLFPLFGARVIGAGDIKLLSGIGAFVGIRVANVIVLAFIFTAIWGICLIFVRVIAGERIKGTRVHLSVPIGMATGVVLTLMI